MNERADGGKAEPTRRPAEDPVSRVPPAVSWREFLAVVLMVVLADVTIFRMGAVRGPRPAPRDANPLRPLCVSVVLNSAKFPLDPDP